ncbi:tRNA (N6-threonylcarbamoyladenosine(37)-N6)-methyltransferase TrmO [Idiomarina sp. HP20-50]|uniref:tRNA (N6-threonylcarbamoyladenosine(37)-N6)-methyltransferase TrmO n=1 Tax=Idiomarina sp. HP20-50 TaxID=3070813 RepID=UPI00294AFA65|nr:tRNA (N6-threonylcarbamoyladenosine(37)-N6)-methyltransferase TrmO [Idiomarina sp. HP20-50]MDV6315420.1 tRNA (N6-threonylcarbamoyladenosine(37)-N6)-methyltransferase TrmO [Idiomarina sp. HP20-50]
MKSQQQLTPIAVIRTPFPEKFSVPRQPGLVPAALAEVELIGDYQHAQAVQGIEQFSHLWLTFEFHQHRSWQERVRPPRLGGNEQLGVFATRSPFRPNQLGLSVVELVSVQIEPQVILTVRGADLVDQTPIVDIKPYIPYVDSIADARAGYAQHRPELCLDVQFSTGAESTLQTERAKYPELKILIVEVLRQDPRPAYHKSQTTPRSYGTALLNYNIRWSVRENSVFVEEISLKQP